MGGGLSRSRRRGWRAVEGYGRPGTTSGGYPDPHLAGGAVGPAEMYPRFELGAHPLGCFGGTWHRQGEGGRKMDVQKYFLRSYYYYSSYAMHTVLVYYSYIIIIIYIYIYIYYCLCRQFVCCTRTGQQKNGVRIEKCYLDCAVLLFLLLVSVHKKHVLTKFSKLVEKCGTFTKTLQGVIISGRNCRIRSRTSKTAKQGRRQFI